VRTRADLRVQVAELRGVLRPAGLFRARNLSRPLVDIATFARWNNMDCTNSSKF
jgi:hypothetical protein